MEIFFEIFDELERKGPGSKETTIKAYKKLGIDNSSEMNLLNIGCGAGAEALVLTEVFDGKIKAIDTDDYALGLLKEKVKENGLKNRVKVANMAMEKISYPKENFDIIWAEGVVYIMGFEEGLRNWKKYLKKDGYLVVSEISWLRSEREEEIESYWNEEYPPMQSVDRNIMTIENEGYEYIDSFELGKECWIENYYNPMQKRIDEIKEKYSGNEEAEDVIAMLEEEVEMYRKYGDCYGYVFYIMKV